MAARRPTSVCLFCQSRQSLIGRRRLATSARQRLETVAVRPEDDGFLLSNTKGDGKKDAEENAPVLPINDTIKQWRLHSRVDELREALLGHDALWQRKDLRLEVLRSLSNPWPEFQSEHQHNLGHMPKPQQLLPEANAAPIPHAAFRRKVRDAISDKDIRKILRVQLLRCEWPKEILRVMAVAMYNKITTRNFAVLAEPITRALYRCRNNVSDPIILKTLNVILKRLQQAEIRPEPLLVQLGLRFAARARSLPAMKMYLRLMRETGLEMTSNVFRSVIAKFSIGHRGLGEIRNGRWRRDQLLQVLKGFDDASHLPPEKQYHLGSFMIRHDWQYLHGWVAVLARCKDAKGVWREWEYWKHMPARTRPKKLSSQNGDMTSAKRGDYWFVEQITFTGDYERAWKIYAETGLPWSTLKDRVKTRLLDGAEFATVWNYEIRNDMLKKYDAEMSRIEKAFGVQWVSNAEASDTRATAGDGAVLGTEMDAEGKHVLIGDQEDALEALGAEDWKLNEDFGFPYGDEGAVVEKHERPLQDAEERGPADG